jgi:GT2 family glycosyltransferase
MSPASTGVVIPSWNGGSRTDRCIASVRAHSAGTARIFLIDNASDADERARLRAVYGNAADVEITELDTNLGYAGGCNVGLERALDARCDAVLILTQDAVLTDGALQALLKAGRDHPSAGVLGPLVVDESTEREWSRGERVSLPLLCVPRTLLRYRAERAQPYRVGGLVGCALLLARPCVERIGGFDPGFFAYYEEVDLCLRARRAGFEILCVPQAIVRHNGFRGFAGGFTVLSAELKARNLLYLMRKHARPSDWLTFWPVYALLIGTSMGWYALHGRADIVRALARGLRSGWRGRIGAPELVFRPAA